MPKKIVCFYPAYQKRTNHFLFNLASLLNNSEKFECWDYQEIQKSRPEDLFKADIYHINWFDQSVSFFSFVKRLYFLLVLHLKKKKIVWTVHNVVPHQKSPWYNKILRFLLVKYASKIHIMSNATANLPYLHGHKDKITFISHGDYFGSYPESKLNVRDKYGIDKNKTIILFVGAIQPYKNVDILISAYKTAFSSKDDSVLLVCGKVEPTSYRQKLVNCSQGISGVILDMNFVPDEDMSAYLNAADILVAPYSYRSSLNSGTLLLAFSYAKTVICPDIACVKDIQNESDCLYSYHYETSEDHVASLSEILKHINQTAAEKEELQRKSKSAMEYMKKYSWQSQKDEWFSLYEEA
jgi:beta-1,4-mannosyltransferase